MAREPRFVLVTPVLPWPADQGSRWLQLEVARALRALGPVAWVTRAIGQQAQAREALRAEGFQLDLDESFVRRDLLARTWRRLRIDLGAWRARMPREAVFTATPAVRSLAAARWAAWPDAVGVGVYWTTAAAIAQGPQGRRVLIVADVEQRALQEGRSLAGSPAQRLGAQRHRVLALAERAAFVSCDRLLCLTAEDAAAARAVLAEVPRPAHVPEVGVWPATVRVPPNPRRPRARPPGAPVRLLMYGHWEAPFNRDGLAWFLDTIWPHLRRAQSVPELRIAGAGLPARLATAARTAGATVLGWVDSLQQELEACDVVGIPLRYAGGLRYRLLEAMAAGRPAICTTAAARGAGARAGEHYLQADDAAAWAEALHLVGDASRVAALVVDGHRFAAETYGPVGLPLRALRALGSVLESAAAPQPGS